MFDREKFDAKVNAFREAAVVRGQAEAVRDELQQQLSGANVDAERALEIEDAAYEDLLAHVQGIDPTPAPAPETPAA